MLSKKFCIFFEDDVLCEVTEADIPQTLIERLAEERSEHTIKKMRFTIYTNKQNL